MTVELNDGESRKRAAYAALGCMVEEQVDPAELRESACDHRSIVRSREVNTHRNFLAAPNAGDGFGVHQLFQGAQRVSLREGTKRSNVHAPRYLEGKPPSIPRAATVRSLLAPQRPSCLRLLISRGQTNVNLQSKASHRWFGTPANGGRTLAGDRLRRKRLRSTPDSPGSSVRA